MFTTQAGWTVAPRPRGRGRTAPLRSPLPLPFASISQAFKPNPAPIFQLAAARQDEEEEENRAERYSVRKIQGDGRCMFRALVQGLAHNKSQFLSFSEETKEADMLRRAVSEVICKSAIKRKVHKEALMAIDVEGGLQTYCNRIFQPTFWGGETELLVLSRLLKRPITVYLADSGSGFFGGGGYRAIQEYGSEFSRKGRARKPFKPVRLLYNGNNHYDLLVG